MSSVGKGMVWTGRDGGADGVAADAAVWALACAALPTGPGSVAVGGGRSRDAAPRGSYRAGGACAAQAGCSAGTAGSAPAGALCAGISFVVPRINEPVRGWIGWCAVTGAWSAPDGRAGLAEAGSAGWTAGVSPAPGDMLMGPGIAPTPTADRFDPSGPVRKTAPAPPGAVAPFSEGAAELRSCSTDRLTGTLVAFPDAKAARSSIGLSVALTSARISSVNTASPTGPSVSATPVAWSWSGTDGGAIASLPSRPDGCRNSTSAKPCRMLPSRAGPSCAARVFVMAGPGTGAPCDVNGTCVGIIRISDCCCPTGIPSGYLPNLYRPGAIVRRLRTIRGPPG